jgi:hypothetical protein
MIYTLYGICYINTRHSQEINVTTKKMDTTRCATFFAMLVFLSVTIFMSEAIRVPSSSIPNFYSGASLYLPPSPRVSQVPASAKNGDLLGKSLGLVSDHGSSGSDSEPRSDNLEDQNNQQKSMTIAVAPSDD